ncbi:MAG: 1-deoxy-D-xylulose-5-phosphate synthase N-terminal domain-containing protein [Anaerobutyricum sp.]
MGRLLNQIKEPNDIKRISPKLYPVLAEEIRDFLLNNVSQTGGHLALESGSSRDYDGAALSAFVFRRIKLYLMWDISLTFIKY